MKKATNLYKHPGYASVRVPFKRLTVGAVFSVSLVDEKGVAQNTRWRKATTTTAFRLKDNGVGETHRRFPFARSTKVCPEKGVVE